jgi:hypothetical protein
MFGQTSAMPANPPAVAKFARMVLTASVMAMLAGAMMLIIRLW